MRTRAKAGSRSNESQLNPTVRYGTVLSLTFDPFLSSGHRASNHHQIPNPIMHAASQWKSRHPWSFPRAVSGVRLFNGKTAGRHRRHRQMSRLTDWLIPAEIVLVQYLVHTVLYCTYTYSTVLNLRQLARGCLINPDLRTNHTSTSTFCAVKGAYVHTYDWLIPPLPGRFVDWYHTSTTANSSLAVHQTDSLLK